MDPIVNFVADVGFWTRIRRSGEFHSHSVGSRSRSVARQSAARPQSRLGRSKCVRCALFPRDERAPNRAGH
jgi:hypothetical protein